jgi:hypothetical protein
MIRFSSRILILLAGISLTACFNLTADGQTTPQRNARVELSPLDCDTGSGGSRFIPVDSWVYPAVLRLYALGYVDNLYVGLRPWTASAISDILDEAADRISDDEANGAIDTSGGAEARSIYISIRHELYQDGQDPCSAETDQARIETVYSSARSISGIPLRDSYHLGSTAINDYGRPYAGGFNSYSGVSGYVSRGRFMLHARVEFQGAPSAMGYSAGLAAMLSCGTCTVAATTVGSTGEGDVIPYLDPATGKPYPQTTIPEGAIKSATQVRVLEAYVSARALGHVFSFGKQDEWLGPGLGGSMAYSNNAQNIYAFHISRTEPLHIPILSSLTGPFRYEFLVGPLRGHTFVPNPQYTPNSAVQSNVLNAGNPWVHVEKLSFRPTVNLELGFERTAMFGGKGHSPVTLHTFLKSFFSVDDDPTGVAKAGREDPGARFSSFDFSYRLPFLRNWVTLYSDAEVHDDVSPINAPRRAAWRPGIYLSRVPGLPHVDVRVEAATTDPRVSPSSGGHFMYWEQIERQGYTNQGQLFGDWIGREDKGGQAWITYHLSGNEWIQLNARNQKADKDFIAGGTTLNEIGIETAKRLGKDLELKGSFTFEQWKAPIYQPGRNTVTMMQFQLTWHPTRTAMF